MNHNTKSAAPEMLRFLQGYLLLLEGTETGHHTTRLRDEIAALIAKATGGAP